MAVERCHQALHEGLQRRRRLDHGLNVVEALEELDVLESVRVSVEDMLLDELALASIDARAANIAPRKPPPDGGGGGTLSVISGASAAPALALLLPPPACLANTPDRAVSGYERVKFDTEWALIACSLD